METWIFSHAHINIQISIWKKNVNQPMEKKTAKNSPELWWLAICLRLLVELWGPQRATNPAWCAIYGLGIIGSLVLYGIFQAAKNVGFWDRKKLEQKKARIQECCVRIERGH